MKNHLMVEKSLLKWTVEDVQNENLLKGSFATIPPQFDSFEQWYQIFHPHIIEETRASLQSCVSNAGSFRSTTCELTPTIKVGEETVADGRVDISTAITIDDDSWEEEEEEDYQGWNASAVKEATGLRIRTFVGVITWETKLADGSFSPKSRFAKVCMIDRKDEETGELRLDSHTVSVNADLAQDMLAYPQRSWSLFLTSDGSVLPFERIEMAMCALCDEETASQRNVLQAQLLSGKFEGLISLPDDAVPPHVDQLAGNKNQCLAIDKILSKSDATQDVHKYLPSIQLIQGPPGTGKSTTIINIICELWKRNKPVLVTAPTNFAISEVSSRLVDQAKIKRLPLHKIVLFGNKSRLKLSDTLNMVHHDLRAVRLLKAFGRWSQNRLLLVDYIKKQQPINPRNREFVKLIDESKIDTQVIAAECPASLLPNNDERKHLMMLSNKLKPSSIGVEITNEDLKNDYMFRLFQLDIDAIKCSILQDADVILCTVSSVAMLRFSKTKNYGGSLHRFQNCIVDEATQLLEPATSLLLTDEMKTLILVGDEKQLPSTVLSDASSQRGLGRSLFERLMEHKFPSTMLNIQYRMHPHISKWPSKKFYSSQLLDGENVTKEKYSKYWHDKLPPIQVYDVKEGYEETHASGSSKFNLLERNIVIQILRQFCTIVETEQRRNPSIANETYLVGIITPYAAQVREIDAHVDSLQIPINISVVCSSVDAFQGKECDVVILSTVRVGNSLGFVKDMRRFNVAITRAKYSLAVVGNIDTLQRNKSLAEFLEHAQLRTLNNSKLIKASVSLCETERLDMFDERNKQFEDSHWGKCISFTNEFKQAVVKIEDGIKGDILKYILHVSRGRWSRSDQRLISSIDEAMSNIVHVHHFGALSLIWCVAVKTILDKDNVASTQMIKVLNIITSDKRNKYLERIAKELSLKSEEYRSFCKERFIQNQLVLPISRLGSDFSTAASSAHTNNVASLAKDEVLSEAGTAIEKTYALSTEVAKLLLHAKADDNIQLPHDISGEEQVLINSVGPHFVLGRSGTGKTTVMVYRMVQNERKIMNLVNQEQMVKGEFKQLLVTASPILAGAIREQYSSLINSGKQDTLLAVTATIGSHTGKIKTNQQYNKLDELDDSNFPLVTTFDSLLRFIDLCLPIPFQSTARGSGEQIDYTIFKSHYFDNLGDVTGNGSFKVDAAGLFKEIISVIKGSAEAVFNGSSTESHKCHCISRDDYVALSMKRMSGLSVEERHHYYNLFLAYEEVKARNGYNEYDNADFASHVYCQLKEQNPLRMRFQTVFVDEVQDLTMLQLSILRFICSEWNGFFFAGDTAQTIAQGVSFRFESLKDLFYNEFVPYFKQFMPADKAKEDIKVPAVKQLKQNFRTHFQILQLANTVIKLLLHFFPDSMDKVDDEMSVQFGPQPIFLQDTDDVICTMFQRGEMQSCEFGSEQVILVRDDATKEVLKGVCGDKALVLTVFECKGMEFSDVLIYNFFSSARFENQQNRWRVIGGAFASVFEMTDKQYSFPKFDEKEHFALCQELKMLYVLITRAKQRIFLFEKDEKLRKVILDLWTHPKVNVVKLEYFNDEMKTILTVKSSDEEWCKRGEEFFQRYDYVNARLCFQRGRDVKMAKLCEGYLLKNQGESFESSNNVIEARKLFIKAAEIFENPPLAQIDQAAPLYEKGRQYDKAGFLFEQLNKWFRSGECYYAGKLWAEAAKSYIQCKKIPRAVDSYFKIPDFHSALDILDSSITTSENAAWAVSFTDSSSELKLLRNKCVKKGAEYFNCKNEDKDMLHFVMKMNSSDEKRQFLKRRSKLQALIEMELRENNFEYAANYYKYQGRYKEASEIYVRGGSEYDQLWLGCQLKLLRLGHIDDSLIPTIPTSSNQKAQKDYKAHLLSFLGKADQEKSVDEIFEIKFWLNDVEGLSLQSLISSSKSGDSKNKASYKHVATAQPTDVSASNTMFTMKEFLSKKFESFPTSLRLRLSWLYLGKMLLTASSEINSVPWRVQRDAVVAFENEVVNNVEHIVSALQNLVSVSLSDIEELQYFQLLDLFGLRLTSDTKFPISLGIEKDTPAVAKLWLSNASQTDEAIASKETESLSTALQFMLNFALKKHKSYERVLNTKAMHLWNSISKAHFATSALLTRLKVLSRVDATAKFEALEVVAHILTKIKINEDERFKHNIVAIRKVMLSMVIFPMFYSLCDSGAEFESLYDVIIEKLLECYPCRDGLVLITQKNRPKIANFDQHARDVCLMDFMSDDRVTWILNSLMSKQAPMKILSRDSQESLSIQLEYLQILWQSRASQIAACNTTTESLNVAIDHLINSLSCCSQFLKVSWNDPNSPFYLREGVLSPFVFLKLAEQTLVLLMLLRNGGSQYIVVPGKLFQEAIGQSDRMKRLVALIVKFHRSGGQFQSHHKDVLEKQSNIMISVIVNTLSMSLKDIETWIKANTKETHDLSDVSACYLMRAMHLVILYNVNTKGFGNKIKDIAKQFDKTVLLPYWPTQYIEFVKQREFSNASVIALSNICEQLGDSLLELRVDSWKTSADNKATSLQRLILHVEGDQLALITVEAYDEWEAAMRRDEELQNQLVAGNVDSPSVGDAPVVSSSAAAEGMDSGENTEDEIRVDKVKAFLSQHVRLRVLEWAKRAKSAIARQSPLMKLQRLVEKEFVARGLGKNSEIAQNYLKNILPKYFELTQSGRQLVDALATNISNYSTIIAELELLDEAHDIVDHFTGWVDLLSPGTVFQMFNPNSDLSVQVEIMIGTMQRHMEEVGKEFHAAQDIMNRINQAIAAHEETLKAKNKKTTTKSSRRK